MNETFIQYFVSKAFSAQSEKENLCLVIPSKRAKVL